MSGRLVLPDTNIFILASQGKFDLTSLFGRYDDVLVSIVSVAEALGFNFLNAAEEMLLTEYFQDLTVLSFAAAEAHFVIAYRKARRRVPFADAAILATARAAGADLLTENLADFQDLDPQVRVLNLAALSA